MYRPNRIGPYLWFDADAQMTNLNVVNFDSVDAASSTAPRYPWVPSATIPDEFSHHAFYENNVSLADDSTISIGAAVSGEFTDYRKGPLFTVDSVVSFVQAGGLGVMFWIGQADASTLAVTHAAPENITTMWRPLGSSYTHMSQHLDDGAQTLTVGLMRQIFWYQTDGSDPDDEYPIIHGVSIQNVGNSAAVSISRMWGYISIHKWINDIDVFEPVRS